MAEQVPEELKSQRLLPPAGRDRPQSGRFQRALPRPQPSTCCSKSRAAILANLSAAPHIFSRFRSMAARKHDRRNRRGDHHRAQRQQPVRRARTEADTRASDAGGSGGLTPLRSPRSDNGVSVACRRSARLPQPRSCSRSTTIGWPPRCSVNTGRTSRLIERRLGVVTEQRGNHVTIEGSRDACEQARRVLEGLYERLRRGDELVSGDVEGAIRLAIAQGSLFDYDPATTRPSFEEINLRKRPVRARTAAQDAYIRALRRHALVFGTGPAGTGKTWLAVAQAVQLFERKEIDRMVFSRPAVEAGERLGFLPGDMREKVDPYLRPIYDALYDLMDARIVERALQTGEIEIAPLAFMRGRTLVECGHHPRRGAKHHRDADEDVSHAAGREQPHDRHRRSEPGRPAVRTNLRPARGGAAAREGRGHRTRGVHAPRTSSVTSWLRASSRPMTKLRSRRGRARARNERVRQAGWRNPRLPSISSSFRPLWKAQRGVDAMLRRAVRGRRPWRQQCDGEVAIVLTDDSTIRALNRDWRGRDEPTNVLSFPTQCRSRERAAPRMLGDIVIAYETTAHEAVARRQAVHAPSRAPCGAWISASRRLRSRDRASKAHAMERARSRDPGPARHSRPLSDARARPR